MNAYIIFGLFAMYVAAISLAQVLGGQQDALLALLRRLWGRRIGHSLYFISHVAIPLIVCVICLGWGIRQYDPLQGEGLTGHADLRLEIKSTYDQPYLFPRPQPFEVGGTIYGA